MVNRTGQVRNNIASLLGNEAKALNDSPSLADIFEKRQKILSEMSAACKKAFEQAKLPFLGQLDELDKEYAMMLQLIGDNKEK